MWLEYLLSRDRKIKRIKEDSKEGYEGERDSSCLMLRNGFEEFKIKITRLREVRVKGG